MNKYQDMIVKQLNIISKHWDDKEILKDSMNYSLFNYGKLFRGSLLLHCLDELNLDIENYVDVACAIEMIQIYTLIHDDLPFMDDALIRRGKKTNHKVYSPGIAILAGDALLTDAFYVISKSNIINDLKIKIIEILSNYAGSNGICYGQTLDINNNLDKELTIDEVNKIILNKTSSFFIAIFQIVAYISKKEDNIDLFTNLGKQIGLAFQIKDDLNDRLNQSIGKDNGIDTNKATYDKILSYEKTLIIYHELINNINGLLNLAFSQTSKVKEYINTILN